MKRTAILLGVLLAGTSACKKNIDLYPESNLTSFTYYNNTDELRAGINGAYSGLSGPLFYEWQVTELRSDNAKQGETGSTSVSNQDLNELDMFAVSSTHGGVLSYWLESYANIRNSNLILQKLGVNYDAASGNSSLGSIGAAISEADRKQFAGEALFIRAYHYFNLVRLYGGLPLVTQPTSPVAALGIGRSSVADTYKLIEGDLRTAVSFLGSAPFGQIPSASIGRANAWAAKGMLAKVYLTQGRKAEALPLLTDVKDNSGYGLAPTYAGIFAINSEMSSEILFAIRFRAGGFGTGSPFANLFAPLNSGTQVINGDGKGLNAPTAELDTLTNGDPRKPVLIGAFNTRLYPKKYLSPVTTVSDAENDWPVLRYADILLLIAEAQGNTPASIDLINRVHVRNAQQPPIDPATITTTAQFEQALSTERRIEFAFENQRWFDLVRFNTTLTTVSAEQTMKDHFAHEFARHYALFPAPVTTLSELQGRVTRERLLLPIPQREIDNSTQQPLTQNPGY
ncbi:RagB/SusD family nutrient uptake outer membrane protein [Flaviaesturariibacter aridisoli]|uniref:RagB/SusD family nutrient uptake outer membrane protein n=1 Tax=Flaviaesturariibacter aridisoli TaxID=2545761 RepID=A0A4R4E5L4_9BACT|nr:RagB/SusD family nutrient uptake outer membrane protein [Flaviaesturariibacter aridisoli]TCZ72935.1 RagB/SusD family nutrient uptake outer membrane protein [Flaviaesturariibacter aridisoli]